MLIRQRVWPRKVPEMLVYQNRRPDLQRGEGGISNLEESFQPPDLEDTLADENG